MVGKLRTVISSTHSQSRGNSAWATFTLITTINIFLASCKAPQSHALQDLDPDYLAASFLFVKGVIFVNINYKLCHKWHSCICKEYLITAVNNYRLFCNQPFSVLFHYKITHSSRYSLIKLSTLTNSMIFMANPVHCLHTNFWNL